MNIKNISSFMLIIFNLLLIIVPIFYIIMWLFVDLKFVGETYNIGFDWPINRMVETPKGYVNLNSIIWSNASKSLACSADLISILPFLISLILLKTIFQRYKTDEIFSINNATSYKRLGITFLLNGLVATPISNALMILAVTLSNPKGQRYLSIAFGTPNFMHIFYGIIIIVVSKVMLEASKMYKEQEFTI